MWPNLKSRGRSDPCSVAGPWLGRRATSLIPHQAAKGWPTWERWPGADGAPTQGLPPSSVRSYNGAPQCHGGAWGREEWGNPDVENIRLTSPALLQSPNRGVEGVTYWEAGRNVSLQ